MDSVTVRIPQGWSWALRLVGAALGVGAAFAVGPVVDWLVGLVGTAPGPLRLAARIPLPWAVPVLAAVGTLVGAWVGHTWQKENLVVTVHADATVVRHHGGHVHIGRDQIAAVFTDGRARHRALADQRPGQAAQALDALQAQGPRPEGRPGVPARPGQLRPDAPEDGHERRGLNLPATTLCPVPQPATPYAEASHS